MGGRSIKIRKPLAAPAQKDRGIVNEQIPARELRVVDSDGSALGIMPREKALQLAREQGLDLVLIAPAGVPPVAKIMDQGKHLYEMEKKAKEAKKKQHVIEVKETKLRYNIGEHDYQTLLKRSKGFLEEGHKVKFNVIFRGRQAAHPELAHKLLQRFMDDVQEVGAVDSPPKQEGRSMILIMSAKRKEKH